MIQNLTRDATIHLWILPRWFGVPISTAAVVLGGTISGASAYQILIATIIGALLMAWGHTMNSWIDY